MKQALLIVGLAFLPWPMAAAEKPADVAVSLVKDAQGHDVLDGHFSIAASTQTIWKVLTDYEGMATFVSSIRSSRKVLKPDGQTLVEQVMSGRAGFFRKRIHLLLEVQETPGLIAFRDISKKSFLHYEGTWTLTPQIDHVDVAYHLQAKPAFFSPEFLATNAFKKSVETLLLEVRKQISHSQS